MKSSKFKRGECGWYTEETATGCGSQKRKNWVERSWFELSGGRKNAEAVEWKEKEINRRGKEEVALGWEKMRLLSRPDCVGFPCTQACM